jgi:Cupredoxin-like domain
MSKKLKPSKKLKSPKKLPLGKLIGAGIVVIIGLVGYYGYQSLIPVNADHPVFLVPENLLIKTGQTTDGHYAFGLQSSKGGKQVPYNGMTSPTLTVSKNSLISVHLINEIKNTPDVKSIHNFNIDEFNVHSKDLEYFDSQSITFLADKTGEFTYYCKIHPEMKGIMVIK